MAVAIGVTSTAVVTSSPGPSRIQTPGEVASPGEAGQSIAPEELASPGAEATGATGTGKTTRSGSSKGKTLPGAGSGAAPLTAGLGPGITDTKIKLGFIIVENNQKMLSFYGVQGGATGDTKQQVNAVIDDLNNRGGILNRKIEVVFRTLDSTASGDPFPAFCAAFTQDEKVFAVISPWNSNAAFHACLAKAGTLYITDALTQEDQETFQEFKPYLVSGLMTSSRGARTLAQALNNAGFFGPGYKLGVIRTNSPTGERVYNNHFKPALAAFGVTPADVTVSALTDRRGADAAQKFSGQGINRVAFITSQGGPALGFMVAAQSMGYFPKYGVASPDSPVFLAQNAPVTQLSGAVGAGWAPGLDVFDSEGPPFSTAEKRCFDIHSKSGTEYTARGGGDVGAFVALTFCDMVWLFEEVSTRAGRNLNAAGFAAELAKMGSSHDTTVTFGTNFVPGAYDGAVQYRRFGYDDTPNCRCWRYTGPTETVAR